MKNSSSLILTTHMGGLVRPPALIETMRAKENGQPYNEQGLATQIKNSVAEVVRQQVKAGIDVISDGEYGKPNFAGYANDRLTGFERRPRNPDENPILNWGRDRKAFLDFYEGYEQASRSSQSDPVVCTGSITYVGQAAGAADTSNFRAALNGVRVEEAFIPAVSPGTIEG